MSTPKTTKKYKVLKVLAKTHELVKSEAARAGLTIEEYLNKRLKLEAK
jgi:hypothetical protein